jgi:hypothetical protein
MELWVSFGKPGQSARMLPAVKNQKPPAQGAEEASASGANYIDKYFW